MVEKNKENMAFEEDLKKIYFKIKHSERFLMLRLLRISHFLPNATFGDNCLDLLTLEELIEKGVYFLLENKRVSQETVLKLKEVLEAFLADGSSVSSFELFEEQPAYLDSEAGEPVFEEDFSESEEILAKSELNSFEKRFKRSSIEAEKILRQSFSNLMGAPFYERIKEDTLASYWDTTGVRDLFIEELSFRQLFAIPIENLFEKHSFTDSKVTAIVNAVTRCLEENSKKLESISEDDNSQNVSLNNSNMVLQTGFKEITSSQAEVVKWKDCSECCVGALANALLTQYNVYYNSLSSDESIISKLIRSLPESLTAKQYLIWWCCAAFDHETAEKILYLEKSDLERGYIEAVAVIEQVVAEKAPSLYSHWTGILGSLGASFDSLVLGYYSAKLDKDYQDVFLKGVLLAFGAERIGILSNYWVKNKHLLQMVVATIKNQERTFTERLKKLKELLPSIEKNDLKKLLE